MKITKRYPSRAAAERVRNAIQKIAPDLFAKSYVLKNHYVLTVSGDISEEVAQLLNKN